MTTYGVLVQSECGTRQLILYVTARTDETACREAVNLAEREYPGEGWRPIRAI